MKKIEKFSSLVASMASQAGVTAFVQTAKVRDLFQKRAERAAYEYIIEENEDRRPVTVQKEKMQIRLNLTETVFKRILRAFENMREEGVPFGIAITPMRNNAEPLASDEFIDFYFNKQKATLAWVLQYMPIGRGYSLDLMLTPKQRLRLLDRDREILWEKKLFYVDFWNSGPIGSGCIAAGRSDGYF